VTVSDGDGSACSYCRGDLPTTPVISASGWTLVTLVGRPGWLILWSDRHVQHLDELGSEELDALGPLLASIAEAVRDLTGAERVYSATFAENVRHVHFTIVPRGADLPADRLGANLLAEPYVPVAGAPSIEAEDLTARLRPLVS
jgi:diadenosine tetraphosphate (Ap4A) HIT family hydrolase